jgi:hypothetical protein
MVNILEISRLVDREIDADNIKIYLFELCYKKVDWMKLTQDPKVRFCGGAYVRLSIVFYGSNLLLRISYLSQLFA